MLGPDSRFVKRQHERIAAPVDAQLYALIRDRREAGDLEDRSDVLAMLLLARDEDGTPMSDEEIRDELVTLIVAGHETTATALAWAFERLTRHPADLRRLEDESRTDETEFAEAVGKETLRLRPVLMNVLRTLREPLEVGELPLPGGQRARAEHLPRPAPPRAVGRRRGRVPAGALPRGGRPRIRLDPVRRRRAPLHRRGVRADGDGGRPARDRRRRAARAGRRRGASDRALHHLLALARGRGPRRRPSRAARGRRGAVVAIAA